MLKQALTSIIATSQSGLTARYPRLRELLISKEAAGSIAPVRVWLYIRANQGGRQTGLVAWVFAARGVGQVLAEFSFWPLGWIASLRDAPLEGAVEVSEWSEVGFRERVRMTLKLPCQWALSPYPTDFRPPDAFR